MDILDKYKTDLLNVTQNIKREAFNYFYKKLKNSNILILGIRQVGKTTIAKQLVYKYLKENKLDQNNFLYLDLRSTNIRMNFLNILSNMSSNIKIIMIDEIQLLENWNNEIQTIIDQHRKIKFAITGSNSLYLKSNTLVGRAVQLVLYPLSFSEYQTFWNNDLNNYLVYGSFPPAHELSIVEIQNSKLSEQIIKDVVRDDIKNKINIDKFFLFTKNILNYINNEVRISRLYNDLKIEHRTGKEYLDILINSQLVNLISNYHDKNLNSFNKKVYFTDIGMISYFNNYHPSDAIIDGKISENIVFNKLSSLYNQEFDDHKIFYLRDLQEIDFIIPESQIAVEVKYSDRNDYLNNGIENLNKLTPKGYKKILITKSTNEKDIVNNISKVSLSKFLLLAKKDLKDC